MVVSKNKREMVSERMKGFLCPPGYGVTKPIIVVAYDTIINYNAIAAGGTSSRKL